MEQQSFITSFTSALHLSLSWASSLSSMLPSHFLKIRLNIILPSTSGCSKRSHSFRFPHQKPLRIFLLPHACYIPRPPHSRFDRPNNIGWRVQIIKLLIVYFSPLPSYLVPLRPKYSPQHPIPKHPQAKFLPQCRRPIFHPHKTTGKIIFLCI